jgi:hypothetical protein
MFRAPTPRGPAHVEIWGELLEAVHFHRRFSAAVLVFGFVALAGLSVSVYLALFRPLAFLVDSDGQATFVGHLREQAGPSTPEVLHVAKEFTKRYAGINSATIESDLADAWNFMTAALRQDEQRQYAAYEREHHQSFVEKIKAQGIQTLLEFDDTRTEVSDHNGKVWSVRLRGTAWTWPLNRPRDNAASQQRAFESFVTLVRCPRTEQTPNGLLVGKVALNTYEQKGSDALVPKVGK